MPNSSLSVSSFDKQEPKSPVITPGTLSPLTRSNSTQPDDRSPQESFKTSSSMRLYHFGQPFFNIKCVFCESPWKISSNGTMNTSFRPRMSSDTMLKDGTVQDVTTKHQCINAMTQYENKCADELRFEDYNIYRNIRCEKRL